MTMTAKQAELAELNRRAAIIERDAEINNQGRIEGDALTEYESLMAQVKAIRHEPAVLPRRTDPGASFPLAGASQQLPGDPISRSDTPTVPRTGWIDARSGQPVATYAPRERFAARHSEHGQLSVGRMMQAMATGNWKLAEPERQVLALFGDSAGSSRLVPDPLSAEVVDLARSASVVFPWGATTVKMEADTLRIARLESDPTFEVKAENAAFDEAKPTIGDITLSARMLGCVVTCSRELAEDAPNFPSLIEQSLSRGLGAELDRLILVGNAGADGVTGIKLRAGNSTGSVGGILWEDFHNAAVAIRALNHQPNGCVLHPTILGDAQILTSGDGTNSAKLWLGPPPSLEGVTMLPTTGITTADAIVGDGRQIVVGFRSQARIEMSTEAGDRFQKHQVGYKITLRFDVGLTHNDAFHVLSGITT